MPLYIAPNLDLPVESVTQTFAILAKRGVGKTHTAVVMTEEVLKVKAGQQVVVCDPVGVWWGLRSSKDGKAAGLPIVIMGGDHADAPLDVAGGQTVADLVVDERISVILDLSRFRKGEQVRFMTDFAERLYHRNRAPLHLMMDEADAFAPQRPMKGEERLLGAVEDLVRRGRARGIGITLVTQRSAVLNKNVLTQIEVLVCLRTIAPQDREAIDAWINIHGSTAQRKELMGSLPSLPIGEAWFWSPGWLDLFQRVKVRERETFDSSATPKVGQIVQAPKRMAEIDLEKLRIRMATTIEKAKADDPKMLRKRIAELEKQLNVKPAAQIDQAALDRAVKETEERCAHAYGEAERKYRMIIANLQSRLHAIAVELHAAGQIAEVPPVEISAPAHKPVTVRPAVHQVAPRTRPQIAPAEKNGSGSISKGERAILIATAQHGDGVTREQLTVLTGYKRSSRDTYLQRLRAAGLVEQAGEVIMVTESGADLLGDEFELLPTGLALQDYWLKRLPEGERRILEIVLRAWPKDVSRESLSEATGYKRSSRDTYLQRLGARKLVVAAGPGEVQASEVFFK